MKIKKSYLVKWGVYEQVMFKLKNGSYLLQFFEEGKQVFMDLSKKQAKKLIKEAKK